MFLETEIFGNKMKFTGATNLGLGLYGLSIAEQIHFKIVEAIFKCKYIRPKPQISHTHTFIHMSQGQPIKQIRMYRHARKSQIIAY